MFSQTKEITAWKSGLLKPIWREKKRHRISKRKKWKVEQIANLGEILNTSVKCSKKKSEWSMLFV